MLQEILTENIAYWLFFCNFSQMNSGKMKMCFKMKEILHFKVLSNIHINVFWSHYYKNKKNSFACIHEYVSPAIMES